MAIIVFSIISFYFENYNQVNLDQALISPFFNKNILGTDQFGRDVFLRASRATYISIMVGFSSNIIASILGVFIGAIAGFYKKFDMLIMGFIETIQSFPTLLILIAIIFLFEATKNPHSQKKTILLGIIIAFSFTTNEYYGLFVLEISVIFQIIWFARFIQLGKFH